MALRMHGLLSGGKVDMRFCAAMVRFWPESAVGVLQSYVRFGEGARSRSSATMGALLTSTAFSLNVRNPPVRDGQGRHTHREIVATGASDPKQSFPSCLAIRAIIRWNASACQFIPYFAYSSAMSA